MVILKLKSKLKPNLNLNLNLNLISISLGCSVGTHMDSLDIFYRPVRVGESIFGYLTNQIRYLGTRVITSCCVVHSRKCRYQVLGILGRQNAIQLPFLIST